MRQVLLLLAAVAGIAVGGVSMLYLQQPAGVPDADGPTVALDTAVVESTGTAGTTRMPSGPPTPAAQAPPAPSAALPDSQREVLLAWSPGGLPAGFGQRIADIGDVEQVSVVQGDPVELVASSDAAGRPVDDPPPGFVIPLDAIAFDPVTYPRLLPASAKAAFAELGSDEALLSRSSAQLRGLGTGAVMRLAGGDVTVAGVVDDALVGAAELAMNVETGQRIGITTRRYVLAAHTGERSSVEQAIRAALPAGHRLRVRGPGETPWMRHGDAVLPQVAIKQRFGEFAYRQLGDGRLQLDPRWVRDHIVTIDIPLLGAVTCHRALVPALEGAIAELQRRNLGSTIDDDGFAGCWNPRFIGGSERLSRHAWGAAADINWPDNPQGQRSTQDERLVEVMKRWGFTWGGTWLIPDPAHFEYLQAPEAFPGDTAG